MAWEYIPGEWGTAGMWYGDIVNGERQTLTPEQYMVASGTGFVPGMSASQLPVIPNTPRADAIAAQSQTDWESRAANFVNAQGQSMTALDPAYWKDYNNFQFLATEPTGGADNKYAAIDSWRNSGAYYDPNAGYFGGYYLPNNASQANLVGLYDENPNLDEWQALPIVLGLAGAALGGGLMSGWGAAGAGAAEAGAGAAAGEMAGMVGGAIPEGMAAATFPVSYAGMPSVIGTELAGAYTIPGIANSFGNIANIPTSGLPGYDPSAGLSGADYASSLTADAPASAFDMATTSSGGMLSNTGVTSGLTGLIQQYGQPLAKALGLTTADGGIDWAKVASGALSGVGGLLSGNAASDAAQTQSDAIIKAAQIAADAAKFKPVGVTTRFGQSQFGYDANGNLVAAGYGLKPDIKAQQDKLMGVSENALTQYQGAQAATAPMGTAANTMMTLGNNYLGTTPEQQAQKYMQEQLALLSAPRETDMANLQARLNATGRGGLAIGGGASGALAANPELNAYYNSIRQQDLGLAANATQGGMDYAKFGAGMVGSGGDMLKNMYSTQSAAYDPYKTALGGASTLEGLGQNAMDLGINIGAKGTAANASAGMLLANGMTNAANVMAPINGNSTWGNLLSGAGNSISNYTTQQQQQQQNNALIAALAGRGTSIFGA